MSSSFRGIFVGLPYKEDKLLWQLHDPAFEKLSCNVGLGFASTFPGSKRMVCLSKAGLVAV